MLIERRYKRPIYDRVTRHHFLEAIAIMRTFVPLRRLMDSNRELAQKIGEMEEKYDGQFRIVFDAIRRLISPPAQPARELGFHTIPPPKPAKKAARRSKP